MIVSICSVLEGECSRSFLIQTEGGTRRMYRSAGGGVQTPDAPGCDRDPSSRTCSRDKHSNQAQLISLNSTPDVRIPLMSRRCKFFNRSRLSPFACTTLRMQPPLGFHIRIHQTTVCDGGHIYCVRQFLCSLILSRSK